MIDLLFETSWEVCNKVGGIYAVLSTKARNLQLILNDKLIFVGPDVWTAERPSPHFLPSKTLLQQWVRQLSLPEGITVRVGRWNIPGKPIAILVNFRPLARMRDEIYGKMWELYSVDSLHSYGDYDEACLFAVAAAMVIEDLTRWLGHSNKRVVAHFDEWTTGMGLLYLKWRLPEVATVFTTHATSVGRSICGNGKPLYDFMSGYNGDQMADELNMTSKHSVEKAAATQADAFTTVSEVTARECEQLLERRPLVTPNAFEKHFVPTGISYARKRQHARERLLRIGRALTGVDFDDDTLIVATSGRCEYRNKGIDAYLDAMQRMRIELGFNGNGRRVLALILVPAWVREPRAELAEAVTFGNTDGLPQPYITHRLNNPDDDAICRRLRELGMDIASRNELVRVVDVPCYLNGDDGIVNLAYYDVLPGLDAAVFPSYYEPWGYTPHESAAFGVPTITTDLAGFGQWVLDQEGGDNVERTGIRVVHRTDGNYGDAVEAITRQLLDFYRLGGKRMDALRKTASKTVKPAIWENFMAYYDRAYEHALQVAAQRNAPVNISKKTTKTR